MIIASVTPEKAPVCDKIMAGENALPDSSITYSSAGSDGLGRLDGKPWYPSPSSVEGSYLEIRLPEMGLFEQITIMGGNTDSGVSGYVTEYRIDIGTNGQFQTLIPSTEGNTDPTTPAFETLNFAFGDAIRIYPLDYVNFPVMRIELHVCYGMPSTTATPSGPTTPFVPTTTGQQTLSTASSTPGSTTSTISLTTTREQTTPSATTSEIITSGTQTTGPTTRVSTPSPKTTTVCDIPMIDDNNLEDIFTVTAPKNQGGPDPSDASTDDGWKPTTGSTAPTIVFEPKPNAVLEGVDTVSLNVEDAESVTIEYTSEGNEPITETLDVPPGDGPQPIEFTLDGIPVDTLKITINPSTSETPTTSNLEMKVCAHIEGTSPTQTSPLTTTEEEETTPTPRPTTATTTVKLPTTVTSTVQPQSTTITTIQTETRKTTTSVPSSTPSSGPPVPTTSQPPQGTSTVLSSSETTTKATTVPVSTTSSAPTETTTIEETTVIETRTTTETVQSTKGTTSPEISTVAPTTTTPPVSTSEEPCTDPMREDQTIPDSNVVFSSTSTAPTDAKIDGTPWTPSDDDNNPSVTVNMDTQTIVKRIDVQAGGPQDGYVPEFRVQYKLSPNGPFQEDTDANGDPKIYDGPQSPTDRVFIELTNREPIYSIKLIPLPKADVPVEVRFELIGCEVLSTTGVTTTTTPATTLAVSECDVTEGMSSPALIPDGSISVNMPGNPADLRPTSDNPFTSANEPKVTITLPDSVELGKIDLNPNSDVISNIDTFKVFIADPKESTPEPLIINGVSEFPADEPLILPDDTMAEEIIILVVNKTNPSDDIKLQVAVFACFHVSTTVASTPSTTLVTTTAISTSTIVNLCTENEIMGDSNIIPPESITIVPNTSGTSPDNIRRSEDGVLVDDVTATVTIDLPDGTELGSITFPEPTTDNIGEFTVEIMEPGSGSFTPYDDDKVFNAEYPLVFPQGVLADAIRIIPRRDSPATPMVVKVEVKACVHVSTTTPVSTTAAETPPTSATSPVVSTVTGGTTTLKITSPSFSPPSSTASTLPPSTTLSLTPTTLSSTISITPTPSPSTAVTPCIKKTLSSATQDNLSIGPGDAVYDSLSGSGNTYIGDAQGGLNNLVYRILAEDDTAEIYEVQLTTKNVKKITVSVYDNNGLNVKTTSQDIVDGSTPSVTTFNFNGTVGITVEINVLAEPDTFTEVSGVEIKVCYTPAILTTTTPSTVPTTSTAPTTPCQDQMLDRQTPQMFNITSTSGEEPPSQALEPTGLTFKPEDENPRVTAVLDTPDDVPITNVTVTLDNVENATIVIVNSDGDIVEQFEVTPTSPGQPETFSVQPTEPGTTIQIIPVPIPSLPPPVVSDLSVKACVHIPSTTPFPSTTARSTTAATTVTPCVSKMISISENPNAVKFPGPTSSDPSTAPADVLSPSGWKPASDDNTPVLTAELQDEDDVASVKKVQVDVQNVQSINAVLKDQNGDVVEEIESNPVNGVVTFDFGSKEGLTIEFQITPVAGQQPVLSDLEIEACIEIRVSTVTTISVTMTTTTPPVVHECILTPEAFEEQFGYYPPNQIGYIEKDGIPGLTSTDEEVSIGDSIEEGIVVIIQCSNCTCMREGIMCNIGPCENCTYTDWESWSECSKDCDVGQRERTRTLLSNPVNTICSEETKQTEDCNIQPCATTTPSCTPWNQWSDCSASGCDVGSRHRSRDCFGNGQNTYDTEPCYSDDPSCLSTTPVCTDGKVWMDCSSPNISFCPIDCRGYRMSTECTEPDACQPACYCPSGQVENEEGVCIDVEDCPCYSESGEIVVEGATWIPDGKKCEVCKCEYGVTKCDPVDDCCDWSDWGQWGSCSQTCNEGTQNRYRTLKNGDQATCGSDQESQTCNNPESLECVDCIHNGVTYQVSEIIPDMGTKCQECYCTSNNEINCLNSTNKIQNGNWASWNEWSECTLNCTGGTRHRTRTCSDPLPECGGSPCPGDNSETEPCNQDISCCTVSQWETWTTCSQTCDGGKQFRIRHYEDPNNAVACNKTVKEERDCNTDPCITTCNITNWTDWTPCDVPCGFGTVTRERSIIGEIVADCPDNLSESDTCYAGDCPCADNQKWSNGTECRRTCANRYDALGYCNDVGCICENGYYFDNNGDCVNETICGICTVNGVNYTSGETFTNPENQCEICECVDGELQCTRTCSIPTCKEDEELSYNPEDTPDSCCPVCKPKPKDTCTLHTVEKVLEADNGCVSNETITFTYCAGGCGNSTYEPVIRMEGEAYPSFKSDCKCCTGTPGGTKEFDLICPGGGVQKAQISILTQCSCDICVDSDDTPQRRR